ASGSVATASLCGWPWGCSADAWLVALLALSSCASRCLVSSCARRTIAALNLCLQKLWGALAKSLQSQWPLTTWYAVLPLLWLAILAVLSASSSASPASTILTALSTRPLHSGNLALALSAISATASRHAWRAGCSGSALPSSMSSQEISVTIAIVLNSITW